MSLLLWFIIIVTEVLVPPLLELIIAITINGVFIYLAPALIYWKEDMQLPEKEEKEMPWEL